MSKWKNEMKTLIKKLFNISRGDASSNKPLIIDKSGIPIMDSSSIVKRVMNYIKLALDERSQYLNIEVIFNFNCNIFTTDIQGNRYLIDGSIGEDMAKAICKRGVIPKPQIFLKFAANHCHY